MPIELVICYKYTVHLDFGILLKVQIGVDFFGCVLVFVRLMRLLFCSHDHHVACIYISN